MAHSINNLGSTGNPACGRTARVNPAMLAGVACVELHAEDRNAVPARAATQARLPVLLTGASLPVAPQLIISNRSARRLELPETYTKQRTGTLSNRHKFTSRNREVILRYPSGMTNGSLPAITHSKCTSTTRLLAQQAILRTPPPCSVTELSVHCVGNMTHSCCVCCSCKTFRNV